MRTIPTKARKGTSHQLLLDINIMCLYASPKTVVKWDRQLHKLAKV